MTELPYEVNKAVLVKKIDDVRVNNKVPGIAEVRDESDRTGLRIAIELKKDADSQTILNYLLKYTELQVNYNFNMVAIDHFTPRQVGLQKSYQAISLTAKVLLSSALSLTRKRLKRDCILLRA